MSGAAPEPESAASVGEARTTFLARVRAALDRGDAPSDSGDPPAPPAVDESLARNCSDAEALADRFAKEAEAVGMMVRRVDSSGLAAVLTELVSGPDVASAAISIADERLRAHAEQALKQAGCAIIDWAAAPGFSALFEASLGVTDVDCAIAESGSLVINTGPARSRGGFLVPPVHVAIVHASRLVADLIDFWRHWASDAGRAAPGSSRHIPAATVVITGPSKTADIEGVLITGVHGPGRVHILLVEDA